MQATLAKSPQNFRRRISSSARSLYPCDIKGKSASATPISTYEQNGAIDQFDGILPPSLNEYNEVMRRNHHSLPTTFENNTSLIYRIIRPIETIFWRAENIIRDRLRGKAIYEIETAKLIRAYYKRRRFSILLIVFIYLFFTLGAIEYRFAYPNTRDNVAFPSKPRVNSSSVEILAAMSYCR